MNEKKGRNRNNKKIVVYHEKSSAMENENMYGEGNIRKTHKFIKKKDCEAER